MKTKVKYTTDTKVELTITLDVAELEAAEQVALKRLARDIKVAGFRKGRVPIAVAQKHIDSNVLQEETLNNALSKAVAESFLGEKLQALERPAVEVKKFVPSQTLEFTAEAEVIPPVKLGDYQKLKSKRQEVKTTAKDVDEIIERMRESFVDRQEVKREAKIDDEVVVDFVGKQDGKAFEGGSAKDYALKLGDGQFIPGFEDGIVGHKSGEEFSLSLNFPKDYHAKDMAGKKVVFDVVLSKVSELKLPEVNDEFAAKCGPFTDVKQLRDDIKREIVAQKEREADEKLKDTIVGELTDISKVALPELLVEDQMRSIEQDMAQNLSYQGITLENYLEAQKFTDKDAWLKKEVRPAAEKRVKAGLILAELSRVLKIDVTREELAGQIEQMKVQYGAKDAKIAKQFDNPDVHRDIANRMITDKTIDKLVELNTKE